MKFEANENGKIITSYLEVECGKGRRSDAERLVALEISSSNLDHLSSSFISTFFPLLSNNIDKKLGRMPSTKTQLYIKSKVHNAPLSTVQLCLFIGLELYQLGVHERKKRKYML